MNTEMQLFSISRKKKPAYEHVIAHKVYENKLNQDFKAEKINQKWCTDFTYLFLTDGSKRYNCTIIDLHDRSVIASITDKNITADLAKRTLEKAIQSQPEIDLSKLLVHSDQGASGAKYEIIWNKNINATQEVIEGTNIPKSFTIKGMKVNGNEVWVHGNATKHMGEFVKSAKSSIMVENELLLSFQDSLTKVLPKVQLGRNFFNIGGWEIGINGDTGVIYHALYK